METLSRPSARDARRLSESSRLQIPKIEEVSDEREAPMYNFQSQINLRF
jgi:hypothetical protein